MNHHTLAVAAVLAGTALVVNAKPSILPPLAPQIGQVYVHPHDLVDVGGGRKMNLYCRGEGRITVIFDSGLSDWSSIWALVQPAVSTTTRACTYDRAGMGYSDVSGRPSSPPNIVADLHQLLLTAGIQPPYLLVGHSLGGFNMKLYASTYRSQVVGMVLVDPAEERSEVRMDPAVRARFGDAAVNKAIALVHANSTKFEATLTACAAEAASRDLSPASSSYQNCTDPVRSPLGADIAAERQVLQVRSAYQAAQASELANSVPTARQRHSRLGLCQGVQRARRIRGHAAGRAGPQHRFASPAIRCTEQFRGSASARADCRAVVARGASCYSRDEPQHRSRAASGGNRRDRGCPARGW